jgi:pSer/pThr/pTyr-binding forkhead associated (FHA) protein
MIECPSCGREHRPGTLFCTECGVYLPTGGPLGTEPIPEQDLPAATAYAWDGEFRTAPPEQRETVVRIKILSSGRQVQLPTTEQVHIGRLDAAHGIFPEVDLSSDGGLEGGVSRRHCKIWRGGGDFFVEDLGSANGTFLNNERLTPYLPHSLKDGYELQLGQVRLGVIIQK